MPASKSLSAKYPLSSNTLEQLKVLIVEDQEDARIMMINMLSLIGVRQISETSNGKQALAFIADARNLIDIIVCDWNMPEMDGVELLRQVRATGVDIPFLMTTGRGDEASVLEAKRYGVDGYIRKPFSSLQLEAKLRILLSRICEKTA